MIGNAHLDVVWLWPWQEGFGAVKATFRAALDLMNDCDDFLFTSSSAALYEWIEHNDPAMFDEIKSRVAEGRWEIAGGWWVQPDCNLPGGESFVRQGLYGQRYFKEKLGVTATVGYNVDSFGHHAMLPQILRKCGLSRYVFMRPQRHEMSLPGPLFRWESDDGSCVLAARIPYEYCTWGQELRQHVRKCAAELKAPFDELLCFYGVGNHGGGPTRENLHSIRAMDADPALPALTISTLQHFFGAVEARDLPLPTVHAELQHHARGCYAAHAGIKQWNRRAENLLLAAEKFGVFAWHMTGLPYPRDFDRAWKDVLFNQFHDILAGTSIEPAYDDARDVYGEATAIATRHLNNALQALAWNIDIAACENSTPIVVFNPHAWPARLHVELEYGRLPDGAELVDDQGTPTPLQLVRSLATSGGRHRLTFVADLPAMGYRVYRIQAGCDPREDVPVAADDCTLENDRFRLRIDAATGCIASLYDKREDLEVLRGLARAVVIADTSDTWAHGRRRFDTMAGMFAVQSVRRVAHGPVSAVIRVVSAYGQSTLIQDITLYRELDGIEVRATIDWREQFALLKLRFPLNISVSPQATYEIPYGHIHRPVDGDEEPGQSWIDLSGVVGNRDTGRLYGLSILNDGKYSFDIADNELGLTVLRSPIYAHHDPYPPRPDEQYAFVDQGIQRFTYTLLPHTGCWEAAGTARRAAELNQPAIALVGSAHAGRLPLHDSFIRVDQENIIVTAVKKGEDGDDVIVRCYETNKMATMATIHLPLWQRTVEAHFAPCEIKTLRVPGDGTLPIVETNMLEWID